jgi:hypothetical protein
VYSKYSDLVDHEVADPIVVPKPKSKVSPKSHRLSLIKKNQTCRHAGGKLSLPPAQQLLSLQSDIGEREITKYAPCVLSWVRTSNLAENPTRPPFAARAKSSVKGCAREYEGSSEKHTRLRPEAMPQTKPELREGRVGVTREQLHGGPACVEV